VTDLPSRAALTRMITAYRISQAIHAAAKLGVADRLKDGSKPSDELAAEMGVHAPSLYRLLRALASVGLFEEDDRGRFRLTPLGAYLRSDVPDSARAFAIALNEPWFRRAWEDLPHAIETGERAFDRVHGMGFWDYLARHPEAGAVFDAAMSDDSGIRAHAVIAAYDFVGVRTVVDVGGGQGRLLAAVLGAHRHLRGVLFDRPDVIAGAHDVLGQAGVSDRCEVVAGDFFDSVPGGADAYILSRIVHDWDDESAIAILRRCRHAMALGKKVLLIEQVIAPGNDPDPAKFTDLNMLLLFAGRERTAAEFRSLLQAAGFTMGRVVPTSTPWNVLEGVAT
jgi:hypothetical protein